VNENHGLHRSSKKSDRRRRRSPGSLTILAEMAGVAGFIFGVLVHFDVM